MGDVVGISSSAVPLLAVKHGFIGQLYEVQSLAITASPASVIEGLTTQLSSVATMDDGSLISLGGGDAQWSILSGPLVGITSGGLATAGEVFINTPAMVRGSWEGISGSLSLTVLNANVVPPGSTVAEPVVVAQSFASTQAGLYQGVLKDAGGNVVGAVMGLKLLSTRAFTGKVVFNGIKTGKYTLAMRAPDGVDTALTPGGDGFASLTMSYLGAATGTLTMADGTTTTFANRV